jgi:hypothetical protein
MKEGTSVFQCTAKRPCGVGVVSRTNHSRHEIQFVLEKNDQQKYFTYSNLDIWQVFSLKRE